MMNVKGKNIIITGGSLGIGKETARELVIKGANVLITGRSENRLIEAKNYTGSGYNNIFSFYIHHLIIQATNLNNNFLKKFEFISYISTKKICSILESIFY